MKPNEKKDDKQEVTIESLVEAMVQKVTAGVRTEYEKTIEQMGDRTKKTISEMEDRLRAILAQMQHYACYNCHKDLISGKDSVYTDYQGHKFCSHKCIDEKIDETK